MLLQIFMSIRRAGKNVKKMTKHFIVPFDRFRESMENSYVAVADVEKQRSYAIVLQRIHGTRKKYTIAIEKLNSVMIRD